MPKIDRQNLTQTNRLFFKGKAYKNDIINFMTAKR